MASAADSGIETGNDSNDSSMQDKILEMETPIKLFSIPRKLGQICQEIEGSSGIETSSEDLNRPHSSTDILMMDKCLTHLQPPSLMHGYEYTPKPLGTSTDSCIAFKLRTSDIPGVFVSGGPLGTQYKASDLVHKLRAARLRSRDSFRQHIAHKCRESVLPSYLKLRDAVRMCRAACHNNTVVMREMLESGISPNVHDGYKRTPLHLAACMGYADMVKLLLEHGADPNSRDSIGNTPLHLAACTHHVPVITLLLQAGTRVSPGQSTSPLQLAITKFNIIRRSEMPHPVLKEKVAQVISMLSEYMKRKEAPSLDAELLNKFDKLVRVSDSSEQVESGICDLLNNLSSLDISSSS